jgi:hypothetical protein
MKRIEIDVHNGIVEINRFDEDVLFENSTRLDLDAIESHLDNFKSDFVRQWLVTDEQFDFINEKYGIKIL